MAISFFGGVGVVGHREEKSFDRETDKGGRDLVQASDSKEKPPHQGEDSGDESNDSKEKPVHPSEEGSADEASDSKEKPSAEVSDLQGN